ncbi:MAG: hypothetical protein J6W85_07780, partial [Lachnospiraceae bacterium]|nr:hypothetical protein [Lachnospiraceae bacterium]
MKNYADLWLGYSKINNPGDTALLKKFYISGASESDKVAANAMKELRTGLKAMLGIEPGIVFGSATAPVSIKCGKDMQDAEEYTVSIREDGLAIDSKSGAGILYGVFDILRSIACGKDVSTV